MLKNKKVNILLALVIAIALWIYVFGSGATTTSTTIRDIPIKLLNTEALESTGLTVLSQETDKISITFTGLRSATSGIKAENFEVTADLQGLPQGETSVRLNIVAPEELKVENMSYQNIKIVVDELASDVKPIDVDITNDTSDETEPYIVQLNREKVKVTGPKTLVDSVVACSASLDATKVTDEMQAISVALTPIDAAGKKVTGVTLSSKNVSITSVLLEKKTVNLEVPVEGEEETRFLRTAEFPKAITLKGVKGDLARIEYIECEPLYLQEVFEEQTVELEPILPDGVQIASDSEDLSAKIIVQRASQKKFDISTTDISFNGVTASTKVDVPEMQVEAVVGGEKSVVDTLSETNFSLSADLTGLEAGEHKVPLIIKSDIEVDMLKCEPAEITVTIE